MTFDIFLSTDGMDVISFLNSDSHSRYFYRHFKTNLNLVLKILIKSGNYLFSRVVTFDLSLSTECNR